LFPDKGRKIEINSTAAAVEPPLFQTATHKFLFLSQLWQYLIRGFLRRVCSDLLRGRPSFPGSQRTNGWIGQVWVIMWIQWLRSFLGGCTFRWQSSRSLLRGTSQWLSI